MVFLSSIISEVRLIYFNNAVFTTRSIDSVDWLISAVKRLLWLVPWQRFSRGFSYWMARVSTFQDSPFEKSSIIFLSFLIYLLPDLSFFFQIKSIFFKKVDVPIFFFPAGYCFFIPSLSFYTIFSILYSFLSYMILIFTAISKTNFLPMWAISLNISSLTLRLWNHLVINCLV